MLDAIKDLSDLMCLLFCHAQYSNSSNLTVEVISTADYKHIAMRLAVTQTYTID